MNERVSEATTIAVTQNHQKRWNECVRPPDMARTD